MHFVLIIEIFLENCYQAVFLKTKKTKTTTKTSFLYASVRPIFSLDSLLSSKRYRCGNGASLIKDGEVVLLNYGVEMRTTTKKKSKSKQGICEQMLTSNIPALM